MASGSKPAAKGKTKAKAKTPAAGSRRAPAKGAVAKPADTCNHTALAIGLVRDYALEHLDRTDSRPAVEPYVVWQCFILGNRKWLISTNLADGMYYEVTYNGAKREFYLDAYKKFDNRCHPMWGITKAKV